VDEGHVNFAQGDSFDFHKKTQSNAVLKGIRKYGTGCKGVHVSKYAHHFVSEEEAPAFLLAAAQTLSANSRFLLGTSYLVGMTN
jgi:hypothetical protein